MLNVKNRAFLIELLNRQALNVTLVNGNQRLSTLKGGLVFSAGTRRVCEARKSHRLVSGPSVALVLVFPGLWPASSACLRFAASTLFWVLPVAGWAVHIQAFSRVFFSTQADWS